MGERISVRATREGHAALTIPEMGVTKSGEPSRRKKHPVGLSSGPGAFGFLTSSGHCLVVGAAIWKTLEATCSNRADACEYNESLAANGCPKFKRIAIH